MKTLLRVSKLFPFFRVSEMGPEIVKCYNPPPFIPNKKISCENGEDQ